MEEKEYADGSRLVHFRLKGWLLKALEKESDKTNNPLSSVCKSALCIHYEEKEKEVKR